VMHPTLLSPAKKGRAVKPCEPGARSRNLASVPSSFLKARRLAYPLVQVAAISKRAAHDETIPVRVVTPQPARQCRTRRHMDRVLQKMICVLFASAIRGRAQRVRRLSPFNSDTHPGP